MNTKKTLIGAVSAVGIALLASAGIAAGAAMAAGEPPQFYLADANTGDALADGTVLGWDDAVLANVGPTAATVDTPFLGSADATAVKYFVSPRGQESNIASWITYVEGGFTPGTQNVLQPNLGLGGFLDGNFAGVKAGGSYSLGFAWVKGPTLTTLATAGVKFVHITVQSGGAGNWTFDNQAPEVDPCADPADCLSEDITLSAQTLAAADAGLTLAVASDAATIGNPTLVDGVSVSTGTLPAITVHDARVVSHPGWTLTSTVNDFTNGTDTIEKKQLGIAPAKTSGPAGATAGAAQTAGSATYPSTFAEADNAASVGDTVLGGALTFVAPVGKPAGTYTSTLTLTLISK